MFDCPEFYDFLTRFCAIISDFCAIFIVLCAINHIYSLIISSLTQQKTPAYLLSTQTLITITSTTTAHISAQIHFTYVRNRWSSERRDQARLGFPES